MTTSDDTLLARVHRELKVIAKHQMTGERRDHTSVRRGVVAGAR